MPIMTAEEFAKFSGEQPASESANIMDEASFEASFGDGIDLPTYANGTSPKTPINISPITPADREKLSYGNEAGKMKFLKEKYGNVNKTDEGDFVIQDPETSLWHRVDAKGMGDGDAWQQTKELISDVTDYLPFVSKLTAQVAAGAGAAATGVGLLAEAGIAGGVAAAIRNNEISMGRLYGTYDATPEEELKDIGIETIMNMGGTLIAPGVKLAGNKIADGISKGAKKIAEMSPDAAGAMKTFVGMLTGAGERNVETLVNNADVVSLAQKKALMGASNSSEAISRLTLDNINNTEKLARAARPALSNMYESMSREVVENTPSSFKPNFKGLYDTAASKLEQLGVGKIEEGAFKRFTDEELKELATSQGVVNPLLFDKQSKAIVDEALDAISIVKNIKEASGAAGAKQLMDLRKPLFDLTYRLKEVADDASLAPAQRIISALKETFDQASIRAFDLAKPVQSKVTGKLSSNLMADTNAIYSNAMNELAPVLRVVNQANKTGSSLPFQTLYKQLQTSSGKNELQKTALDRALDLISNHGGEAGKVMKDLHRQTGFNEAAIAFLPLVKQSLISQTSAVGAGTSLAFGNPTTAAIMGTGALATSPRLNMTMIKTAMKARGFISNLKGPQLQQFLNNPEAVKGLVSTVINAPSTQEQVKQQLMQQGIQRIQGQ